jgi:hypothetical protein
MSETTTQNPANLPEPRSVILFSHTAQLVLAITIMGLDAYGVRYVAYNALICSLIVVGQFQSFVIIPSLIIYTVSLHCPSMYLPYRVTMLPAEVIQSVHRCRVSRLDAHVLGH